MSRTRLTAVLVAVALGGAGLVPAAAAPSSPTPRVAAPADHALQAAVGQAATAPSRASLTAWRTELLRSAGDEPVMAEASGTSSSGPARERAGVYEVGDVDGDRHVDVAVQHSEVSVVRSGRDGRVLLRRPDALLIGARAGAVRLVSLEVEFVEQDRSYDVVTRLQGLDRRGRRLWAHEQTGTASFRGVGPAYVSRVTDMLAALELDQRDAAGRPALVLGTLSVTHSAATTLSRMHLSVLSLADGSVAPLDSVRGAGQGIAYAQAVAPLAGARTCYATTAPTAAVTRVGLACDGEDARWSALTKLRDAYVADGAGDFDGDGQSDLVATSFGFERPKAREVQRGTVVLSRADGSSLATSALDGLAPLGADVDRDGEPDFLQFAYDDEGFGVEGVTLAGKVLYRATLELRSSGMLQASLGLDITGDGVRDGYLRAAPQRGTPVVVVLDGRTGRQRRLSGVEALLWPAFRRTGADLVMTGVERGRLRTTVLAGNGPGTVLDVRVPGRSGTPTFSGAGALDLSRDGRRDLVVASRVGDHRVTTAFSSAGRVLWQTEERAAPLRKDDVIYLESSASS